MKNLIGVICFVFCLTAYAAQAEVGDRHSEMAGGFSLQAPKGWQFRVMPGMKYQFAFGPASNSFSPNINVVDDMYSGDLNTYVDRSMETLNKMLEQFTLIQRNAFVTRGGMSGERVVTTSLQQKRFLLRQSFYFLPGTNGKYFVVTCSTLASGGEALDSVFDESVKTFEIIR
jgi:hypothetical protein